MINQELRRKAMDLLNEMELEAETISERRLIAICWWTLYAMSFPKKEDQIEHVVYVEKVAEDFVKLSGWTA